MTLMFQHLKASSALCGIADTHTLLSIKHQSSVELCEMWVRQIAPGLDLLWKQRGGKLMFFTPVLLVHQNIKENANRWFLSWPEACLWESACWGLCSWPEAGELSRPLLWCWQRKEKGTLKPDHTKAHKIIRDFFLNYPENLFKQFLTAPSHNLQVWSEKNIFFPRWCRLKR